MHIACIISGMCYAGLTCSPSLEKLADKMEGETCRGAKCKSFSFSKPTSLPLQRQSRIVRREYVFYSQ